MTPNHTERVEILGFIMADIDADLSRRSLPLGSIDSQHASQSLWFCKEAIEDLKALYRDLLWLIQPSAQVVPSHKVGDTQKED
jgi:hypothetical protein